MVENEELPCIGRDIEWVDLKVGEKAVLKGKTKFTQGDTAILVGRPDWSYIAVSLTDEGGAQTDGLSFLTSPVSVIVERTENGLRTSVNDIKFV